MKKAICLILVLALCLSFACTAFATGAAGDDDFVESPGSGGGSGDGPGYPGEGPEDPTEGTGGKPDVDPSNPQTGDNSGIGMWILVMILAAVALVVGTVVYQKKFANQ